MKKQRLWADDEIAELMRRRRAGETYAAIGNDLGRAKSSCRTKFNELNGVAMRQHVTAAMLADRDARALAPRTVTATLCGDPPPGYSALDRRETQRCMITLADRVA